MRQKIEIKVYLPYMMVGELEVHKRHGNRSKFIEDAVRARLDGEEAYTLRDIDTNRLIAMLMARYPDDQVMQTILLKRMEELV